MLRGLFSRKCCIAASLLFYLLSFFAIGAPVTNIERTESVTLKRISAEEGLSQGSVVSIHQDRDGFIWLGTWEGLNFYNGYQIKQFLGPNQEFKSSYINFIFQDSDGRFWVSILEYGLYRFDPKQNTLRLAYSSENNPNNDVVDYLIDDASDKIWFVTASGLVEYNRRIDSFSAKLDLSDRFGEEQFFTTVTAFKKQLLLGSNKGMVLVDITDFSHKFVNIRTPNEDNNDPFKQRIRKLIISPQNEVWIATARGLFTSELSTFESLPNQPENIIRLEPLIRTVAMRDLLIDGENMMVASKRGLYQVGLEGHETELVLQFSNSNHEVFNNRILKIFKDRSGNFWLSSNSRGVYIWNPKTSVFSNKFNAGSHQIELSDNEVWDIQELDNNDLWIGTTNGLTNLNLDTNKLEVFLYSEDGFAETSNVMQVEKGKDNTLWLATYGGIINFDPEIGQAKPAKLKDEKWRKIFSDEQSFFKVDNQGRLWITTLDSFYLYSPESGDVLELESLATQANPYFSFGFMGELPGTGDMLMSSSGQLWAVDSEDFQARKLFELDSFTPQEFVYIDNWSVDEENNLLWVTFTNRGLMALSLDDFQLIYEHNKEGRESIMPVYGAMQDQQRRLWFSSHDGIHSIGLDSPHVATYDVNYGLSVMEFNSGANTKLKDGRLVYGSVKGITIFDPEQITKESDAHSRVVFDRVSTSTNPKEDTYYNLTGETFEFAYNDAGYEFVFSTLGLDQQNRVKYEYELLGSDSSGVLTTTDNKASYTQLSPGVYEFRVRAISPFTGYKTKPSSVFVNVAYAPWASPFAKIIYGLVFFSGLLAWIYRRRFKQKLLTTINRELVLSEQRLQMALRSSSSHAWEWDVASKTIDLATGKNEGIVNPDTFRQHYQQIHPDDRREFLKEWQTLFDNTSNDAFNFTYRIKQSGGDYGWFRNVGRILNRNENGKPTRITGLFTDITEVKTVEESASIFGEAFKNTKDWVVVVDSEFTGITANNSFYDAFRIAPNRKFSLKEHVFSGLSHKMRYYKKIMTGMSVGEHWHGEDTIKLPGGKEYHLLINISLINVEHRDDNHYVVIFTDISAQKNAEEELRKMANYDPLTSLPNRTLLMDRLEYAIRGADRNKDTLALLFLDLDRFKPVNDSLGHEFGDLLLQKIAQRLKSRVRRQDTVARLGGDEFVVLLESFKDVTHVGEVAQEIAEHVGRPVQLGAHKVSVAPSIGIALYPSDARTPADLLRDADIAMYHSKKDPGISFHFYTDSMDVEVRETLRKEHTLKQAQQNQEFVNYYQPIIDSSTGEIAGAELLLRWLTVGGIVAPKEFIPLSEQIGLIIPMTNDALSRGLAEVKIWRETYPDFYLSLNLSVIHFEQESVADEMAELLTLHNLPPTALRVEVTESALMSHPEKAITTMRRFMENGIMLALDDFGTGYSSFAYLKRLPLNAVKLDRSFIWGIGQDEKDEIIIDAILAVAESMDLYCVAEGVETELHETYLKERRCHYLQGFLYSKPLPFVEFCQFLQNYNGKNDPS